MQNTTIDCDIFEFIYLNLWVLGVYLVFMKKAIIDIKQDLSLSKASILYIDDNVDVVKELKGHVYDSKKDMYDNILDCLGCHACDVSNITDVKNIECDTIYRITDFTIDRDHHMTSSFLTVKTYAKRSHDNAPNDYDVIEFGMPRGNCMDKMTMHKVFPSLMKMTYMASDIISGNEKRRNAIDYLRSSLFEHDFRRLDDIQKLAEKLVSDIKAFKENITLGY
jgi:hypothetical protein